MSFSEEQKCALWLSAAEVSSYRRLQLKKDFGSDAALWQAFDKSCQEFFPPQTFARLAALHAHHAMDEYLGRLEKDNVHVLFLQDGAYPPLLRSIDDPPYALYYLGNLQALTHPCISVIGTRSPSGYGRDMARSIAYGLAQAGVCVVSGLARGIDGCAHEGALGADGLTAAVLGTGINLTYPPEHASLQKAILESGGIVLSEYPLDAEPMPFHFPHRNRIISGISQGLVFVEGRIKSGGMLTVSAALSQGREVFAVPGRVGLSGSEGPHTILREGARLVTSAKDILEDLELSAPVQEAQETPSITALQADMIAALGREPMTLDQLSVALGQAPLDIHSELSILEIMGMIKREAGNLFALCAAH